jgi:hypothetical protein
MGNSHPSPGQQSNRSSTQIHEVGVNELDLRTHKRCRHGSGVIISVFPSSAMRYRDDNVIKVYGKKSALLYGENCRADIICDGNL